MIFNIAEMADCATKRIKVIAKVQNTSFSIKIVDKRAQEG